MQFQNEPRGFRNNNPGNIRLGEHWLGLAEQQTDSDFCQFISIEYGLRAIFKILDTYRNLYRLTTIREIINRWAPPHANNTKAYIESFINYMPNSDHYYDIRSLEQSSWLVAALIHHENGLQPFSIEFIKACQEIQ